MATSHPREAVLPPFYFASQHLIVDKQSICMLHEFIEHPLDYFDQDTVMMSFTSFFRRSALAIAILAATGCTALANPSTGRCHIAAQSSMRSAVPADQLGETAYNHVVYSAPFRHATGPLGDDPRSSMRNAVSAEQAGEAEVSHALYTETVADHYRPGDGHASMRSARPASQLGE